MRQYTHVPVFSPGFCNWGGGGGEGGYIKSGMHLVISLLDAVTNMFWAPILVGLVVVINQKKGTVGTALPNRGVYCHYQGTLK